MFEKYRLILHRLDQEGFATWTIEERQQLRRSLYDAELELPAILRLLGEEEGAMLAHGDDAIRANAEEEEEDQAKEQTLLLRLN